MTVQALRESSPHIFESRELFLGVNALLAQYCLPLELRRKIHALVSAAALKFELLEPVHVQIDGEPWLQPTGTITIELAGKSAVLSPLKGRAAPPQSSTRVVPSGSSAATAPQASRLPPEWKESYDPVAQHEYWENSKTGETRWNRPC